MTKIQQGRPVASPAPRTSKTAFEEKVRSRFAGRTPPPHDVRMPKLPPGQKPKGVIIGIHGGGWKSNGRHTLAPVDKSDLERWRKRGWITVNIDYRPGADSMKDVLAFHDAVRDWQGPDVRLGATGQSAGGHLAMMMAAKRPGTATRKPVEFVVSEGGPTDLAALPSQGTPTQMFAFWAAAVAFGKMDPAALIESFRTMSPPPYLLENLRKVSPAAQAARTGTRLLVANARNDEIVPVSQVDLMSGPNVKRFKLDAGDQPWVHAGVSRESLSAFHEAELEISRGRPVTRR